MASTPPARWSALPLARRDREVLQPTAAIQKTGIKTIATKLLTQKKDAFMTAWVDKTQASYCKGSQVKYQVGYAPSPDPCATTGTTTT